MIILLVYVLTRQGKLITLLPPEETKPTPTSSVQDSPHKL